MTDTNQTPRSLSDQEAFGHWLSGLVDGEGAFMLQKKQRCYRPIFQIALRADDTPILQRIQQHLGCGKPPKPGKPFSSYGRPMTRYRFGGAKVMIASIIPHFVQFPLQSKKVRDFLVWKEAVECIAQIQQRGRRWSDVDSERVREFARQLKEVRKYTAPTTELGC